MNRTPVLSSCISVVTLLAAPAQLFALLAPIASVAFIVSAGGCAPAPGPPRPAPTHASARTTCPLGVEDARVAVEDTSTGVALVFKSSAERQADLRERVRGAGELHGPLGRMGKGHDGRHATGGRHGLHAMTLPRAHAEVADVAFGARLSLVPTYPDQLAALRSGIRERVREMTLAACDVGG